MRVLFDGYWWDEGPISNRVVQRQIVRAWASLFPNDELAVAGPGELLSLPTEIRAFKTRAPLQALSNALELPLFARRWRADIVVSHNYAAPARNAISAVFVHDLMFLDRPEWFTRPENAYFRLMRPMARNSDLILTSSQSEATRIRKYVRSRRAEAVGLAINPDLLAAQPIRPAMSATSGRFALAVGRLNVRKNLGRLVEGAIRSESIDPERPLVIVGESSGRSDNLSERAQLAVRTGAVVFAGAVPDAELSWLYRNADLFLFLSLDEGFGLPCLEAAYFGTPAIVSNIAVFREILGDSATYVDPTDVDAISEAIALQSHPRGAARPVARIQDHYNWAQVVRRIRESVIAEREVE